VGAQKTDQMLRPPLSAAAYEESPLSPEDLSYPGRSASDEAKLRFAQGLLAAFGRGQKLPEASMKGLLEDSIELLRQEKTLVRVSIPPGGHLNVVGDVHGQFFDVAELFRSLGQPSEENPFLFNGDFVDRGSHSVETLATLLAFKVALPSHVHLARGNHEAHAMNILYGFAGEVLTKYGRSVYRLFQTAFDHLPLTHVVNDHVLVVHGGLSRNDDLTLADIERLDPSATDPDSRQLLTDLLWSDPSPQEGRHHSRRGANLLLFGPDVTGNFLSRNDLGLVIRSHEVKEEGYEWAHDEKCLTVFSAPAYCDACENQGAVAQLQVPKEGGPPLVNIKTFTDCERPDFYVPAMAYSMLSPISTAYLTDEARAELSHLSQSL